MPADPLVIRSEPLEDGLTLVRQAAPAGALSVSLTYVGPAGTAYDPVGREGTALLAGELAIVAAGRRDRRALARHLDALGATLSDHPSPECLEITAWGPAARWEALLEVLADAVFRPRYDADDVARGLRELRERQLRQQTQPEVRAEIELLHSVYPPDHPYYRTGIGDARSLRRIDREGLRRFHRDHFVTRGASLVVTGNLPEERLRDRVRRSFVGQVSRGPPSAPEVPAVGRPRYASRHVGMPGRTQVEIRIGTTAVPRRDPRFPSLYLADEVLGGQVLLSRLFQRVREREGLAYHASSELEAVGWGGFWEAQAGTGPERADAVEGLVLAEFDRLRERPIPGGELDRIRESVLGSIALDLETTQGAHDLAVSAAYYRLPEDFYRRWPDELRGIRPRTIHEALVEVLDRERLAVVRVGPE